MIRKLREEANAARSLDTGASFSVIDGNENIQEIQESRGRE